MTSENMTKLKLAIISKECLKIPGEFKWSTIQAIIDARPIEEKDMIASNILDNLQMISENLTPALNEHTLTIATQKADLVLSTWSAEQLEDLYRWLC